MIRWRWIALAVSLIVAGLWLTSLPEGDEQIGARLHQIAKTGGW